MSPARPTGRTTAGSAATGAKDQVARLLALVPYLHARGQVGLEQAAGELGVAPTQLLEDLKVLLMCGLPGGFPDDLIDVDLDALEGEQGDRVIRVSNAEYLARPLRLTPTEATAIIVALRALRGGAGPDTREIVDRVLAKLEAAAAEGSAAGQIDPGEDPAPDLTRLEALLRSAADRRRQVELTYYVPARDEESERTVDPRGVVWANGFAYLDAWCHSAEAPRLFRLDRIHDAVVLDTAITTEPQPPRDLADGLVTPSSETTVATLLLQPPARWVVEYYPVEAVRPHPGGAVEVDLRVADARWLERLVLRLAPHASVVAPAELDESVRRTARAALGLYG